MYTEFKKWLLNEKKLSAASSSDVVSRIFRVQKIIAVDLKEKPVDELIMLLNREPNFQSLSVSVKSQLRRAIKLYKDFLDS